MYIFTQVYKYIHTYKFLYRPATCFHLLMSLCKWSWKVKVKFRLIIFTATLVNETRGQLNMPNLRGWLGQEKARMYTGFYVPYLCMYIRLLRVSGKICMRQHVSWMKLATAGSMNESIEWAGEVSSGVAGTLYACDSLHLDYIISKIPVDRWTNT